MNSRTAEAVNDQVRAEFQAAYFYLSYAALFELKGLTGFAAWMRKQFEEEQGHALKLYDHLLRRGAGVTLKAIEQPDAHDRPVLEVFEQVLEHERNVTGQIHALYALAKEEKDYALEPVLHWFIDEQIEEEDTASKIVDRLRLVGDSRSGLLMLDREMGER